MYTTDPHSILERFSPDGVDAPEAPQLCPIMGKAPRGRRTFTIPRVLRGIFAFIITGRTALNQYQQKSEQPSYYEFSQRINNAQKKLEEQLRIRAGLSESCLLEYHSGWKYRVLRPRRKKVKLKIKQEKQSHFDYGYLDRPIELWHMELVPRKRDAAG